METDERYRDAQIQSKSWDAEYYRTQQQIMLGTPILREVAKELKLQSYFEVEAVESAMVRVKKLLQAIRIPQSRIFHIKAVTPDPQLSARLANSVARAYIRKSFQDSLSHNQEVLGWLEEAQKSEGQTIAIEDPFGNVKQMTREGNTMAFTFF